MLYFAFGSNLDVAQMRARCPQAQIVGTAVVRDWALCFTGYSAIRGGAVASLRRRPGSETPGLVYSLTTFDLYRLDGFEGCPRVYARRMLNVKLTTSARGFSAIAYLNNDTNDGMCGRAYLNQIQSAYDRFGFDNQPLQLATWGLT